MKSCLNRRSSFAVLVLMAVLGLASGVAKCGTYGGGSGTEADPYRIYDANHMQAIGADLNDWDKHFKLMADINLGGYTGTQFNIIGKYVRWNSPKNKPFNGVFDGNQHVISNFNYSATHNIAGLFSFVDGDGEIRDLGIENADVNCSGWQIGSLVGYNYGKIFNCYATGKVTGTMYIGGLVGEGADGSLMDNCSVNAIVSATRYIAGGIVGGNGGEVVDCNALGTVIGGDGGIGGIVGENYQLISLISNCHSSVDVTGEDWGIGGLAGYNAGTISACCSTGNVSGHYTVGGLVGYNGGVISNCYATGDVTGSLVEVGGLAGANTRLISNCYETGRVTGPSEVGGLVGYGYVGNYTGCFWNREINPDVNGIADANDPNVIGKTTTEMQDANTFIDAGWDFNTPIWKFCSLPDYPKLSWQECAGPEAPVLDSEPEMTLGTTNTIFWAPVADANDYYAECANDANFASIVDNSSWIADTNYTFTGLELGQRYWYRVKAKDASGIESDWSNIESSLQVALAEAVETVLDANSLKNANMKNAFLNKIDAALAMIDEGQYQEAMSKMESATSEKANRSYEGALNKLENDILAKTNGCAETGELDKNDWITSCEEQTKVYPLIMETIEYVRSLME